MALFGCASDEQFMNELAEEIFERHTGVSYQDYLQGVTEDPCPNQIGEEFYGALGDDDD